MFNFVFRYESLHQGTSKPEEKLGFSFWLKKKFMLVLKKSIAANFSFKFFLLFYGVQVVVSLPFCFSIWYRFSDVLGSISDFNSWNKLNAIDFNVLLLLNVISP